MALQSRSGCGCLATVDKLLIALCGVKRPLNKVVVLFPLEQLVEGHRLSFAAVAVRRAASCAVDASSVFTVHL